MKYCDFIKSAPKGIFAKWERHRRGTADFPIWRCHRQAACPFSEIVIMLKMMRRL